MVTIGVEKKDLKNFGQCAEIIPENGYLAITCALETSKLEEIFISACLKDFGEEYGITNTEDSAYTDVHGIVHKLVIFETNLPFEEFEKY